MPDTNSTPSTVPGKPTKPNPEFPLTPHPAGYWCKKIRGELHYFGPSWKPGDGVAAATAADAALNEYNAQKDALHAGRKPREMTEGTTIKDLANAYLNHKRAKLEA